MKTVVLCGASLCFTLACIAVLFGSAMSDISFKCSVFAITIDLMSFYGATLAIKETQTGPVTIIEFWTFVVLVCFTLCSFGLIGNDLPGELEANIAITGMLFGLLFAGINWALTTKHNKTIAKKASQETLI